eukprot:1736670-Pyramimonas_sp.AAC.1
MLRLSHETGFAVRRTALAEVALELLERPGVVRALVLERALVRLDGGLHELHARLRRRALLCRLRLRLRQRRLQCGRRRLCRRQIGRHRRGVLPVGALPDIRTRRGDASQPQRSTGRAFIISSPRPIQQSTPP